MKKQTIIWINVSCRTITLRHCFHTIEYYLAIERNEVVTHGWTSTTSRWVKDARYKDDTLHDSMDVKRPNGQVCGCRGQGDGGCPGLGEKGGEREGLKVDMRLLFGVTEIFQKLECGMVAQLHKYTKCHWILHLKLKNFIYKFYLNKAVSNRVRKTITLFAAPLPPTHIIFQTSLIRPSWNLWKSDFPGLSWVSTPEEGPEKLHT